MSTPATADSSLGPLVKIKGIPRAARGRLRMLLESRHWDGTTSLEPLLRRGGALQAACRRPRYAPGYSIATDVLVERWGSCSIDDLNFEAIWAWYHELQTGPEPRSGQRLLEIHNVLETTLRTAAVERDTGQPVTAMTRKLLPVWRMEGSAAGAGNVIASALMRRSGRRGAADSIAMSLPTERSVDLWMVSGQLHLSDSLGMVPKLLWSCESSQVESVKKAPRLQLLSRVTIRFADGSRASFMAQKRFAIAATRIQASALP